MHSEVGNVLIVLVHKPSCTLNDKVGLVPAIVLDVSGDMAEVRVFEVTSQKLKKNRFACSRRAH